MRRFNARWNRIVVDINSWLKWQKKITKITNYGKKWNRMNATQKIIQQSELLSLRSTHKDCNAAATIISAAASSILSYHHHNMLLLPQQHCTAATTTIRASAEPAHRHWIECRDIIVNMLLLPHTQLKFEMEWDGSNDSSYGGGAVLLAMAGDISTNNFVSTNWRSFFLFFVRALPELPRSFLFVRRDSNRRLLG